MEFLMEPSAEPQELDLPLEFKFAMRKAELQAAEMTWDQLYAALLNLYNQRLVEITAIKDILVEEGVNIEFDLSSELELEELAQMYGCDEDEESEDDDETLLPF
jgi:hypothetical protein